MDPEKVGADETQQAYLHTPRAHRLGWVIAGGLFLLGLGLAICGPWLLPPQPPRKAPPLRPLELAPVAPVANPQPELAWLAHPTSGSLWGALQPKPPAGLEALAERGALLFAQLCSACHGAAGRGDGEFSALLPRRPRDLAQDAIRSRSRQGALSPDELYRTLTAGAPSYGMPSFAQLPEGQRWALVAHLLNLRPPDEREQLQRAVQVPPAPKQPDLALGQQIYRARCASCHGLTGEGDGPAATGLRDERGEACPPTRFAAGPDALRTGARPEDIARTLQVGRPGTPMLPFALEADQLWALSSYVSLLARTGLLQRRQEWNAFLATREASEMPKGSRVEPPEVRWDPERSARHAVAPPGDERGCLACHEGIAPIAEGAMQRSIAAFAAGRPGGDCVVCHEGHPGERDKTKAHRGLIGNPGSLWVTSLGLGCGKCHSDRGALRSLLARPFPEAVGGALLEVVSRRSDPSGASGRNHAYRMQRALMAQETGKVLLLTASAGLTTPDKPRYTDLPVDDTDGPVPCVGSEPYKSFMARALELGYVQRLERGEGLPTFDQVLEQGGKATQAGYVDYFRKDCARCHLWGEGKASQGEYRSSGCSACHVLYNKNALSESADDTIPKSRSGHALRHELVLAIPEEQCNHCHTRGLLTQHSEAHQRAGIGCADCHSSIDVHGDGNIYPSIEHQLEIRCEDCHGTAEQAPWELPIGHGTPAKGSAPRGVFASPERQHLLTNRGNARTGWLREGERAVLVSEYTGQRHEVPLLHRKARAEVASPSAEQAHGVAGHSSLSCALCHSSQSPRCMPCHLTYTRAGEAQDWLLSALRHDPHTTRQSTALTPGQGFQAGLQGTFASSMPWGSPETREDRAGRLAPRVPGCDVYFTIVDERGRSENFVPRFNPGNPDYPPPIAPTLTHEKAIPARSCASCHGEEIGAQPARLPGARRH